MYYMGNYMNRIFVFYNHEYYPNKDKYELIHEFDSLKDFGKYYVKHYNKGFLYDGKGIVGYHLKMYDCDPINSSAGSYDETAIQLVGYDHFITPEKLEYLRYSGKSQPSIIDWITTHLREKIIDCILD